MLKFTLSFLVSIFFMGLGFGQTELPRMYSKSNPPVEETVVDSNALYIMIKLHENAHMSRDPRVIYDSKKLDPFACYRSFINKTTGTEFWLPIDCKELKLN